MEVERQISKAEAWAGIARAGHSLFNKEGHKGGDPFMTGHIGINTNLLEGHQLFELPIFPEECIYLLSPEKVFL